MALTTNLVVHFTAAAQSEGQSLFRSGNLMLRRSGSQIVEAYARRPEQFEVRLRRKAGTVTARCSCEAYRRGQWCKHIWATLLSCESRQALDRVNRAAPTKLERTLVAEGPPPPPAWDAVLKQIRAKVNQTRTEPATAVVNRELSVQQILYILDGSVAAHTKRFPLEVKQRRPRADGSGLTIPASLTLRRSELAACPDPLDRQILALLNGATSGNSGYASGGYSSYRYGGDVDHIPGHYYPSGPLCDTLLPLLGATGRWVFRLEDQSQELTPLTWDDGPAWELRLDMTTADDGGYRLRGVYARGDETRNLSDPVLILAEKYVIWGAVVAKIDFHGAADWAEALRARQELVIPPGDADRLLAGLFEMPRLPPVRVPPELEIEEYSLPPTPILTVKQSPSDYHRPVGYRLLGTLTFDYGGLTLGQAALSVVYDPVRRRLIRRDLAAEKAFEARLLVGGFREVETYPHGRRLELIPKRFPALVRELIPDGWRVEAEGKLYRKASDFRIEVTSTIDWFELHGSVEFDGVPVHLPQLLSALRRGDGTVELGDGTFGLLPEEWLAKLGPLAGVGTTDGDHLKFRRTQVGLLDALLAERPDVSVDAVFDKARQELRSFSTVEPAEPPPGFRGDLRPYQKEGLGWLHFLRRFGFGGCLADDMGLGKTVQVLALLEERGQLRRAGEVNRPGPSLVVVPRSLVFNWKAEAARFAPDLRVLDHTGLARAREKLDLEPYDLVLTTYGTLRRDIAVLKDVEFDYCILDEAQAIKNQASAASKAARLLTAQHRLAMSGTPIENHLGELWSLFEFLNPGLLGSANLFQGVTARSAAQETREVLARGLRPFMLRRTKQQVAKDLPEKTEQTIFCELEGVQLRRYNELRDYYRQNLLGQVEAEGMNKARFQVLEALLRLRQAACHPGLVDKTLRHETSAKLEALMPQLRELLDEGHKILVFSQFTTMLGIIKAHLDSEGLTYEYLDGKTTDRQARVERFQTDPDCKLFLISLKAGGVGLNLTAAEYVFLLDPWWNPAVEAQAIDRTHRIGQTKPVFAYRLIARGTVEEKVLALQATKRELADAILSADNSLIGGLKKEDLEELLS